MATSLAAAIKTAFDVEANLVKGHDGIYEVSAGGRVVYSNSKTCKTGFPEHREIIESISSTTGMTHLAEVRDSGSHSDRGPASSFPQVPDDACGQSGSTCCGDDETS